MTAADPIPEVAPSPQDAPGFRQQMGQVSRHSAVFFAGTIFTAGTAYLFKIYLARELGAEALGIYALGMTMVGFLGIFNALGLPWAAIRFVAAYNATGKMDLLRGFLLRSTAVLLAGNLLIGALLLLLGPWIAVRFYHTPALKPYLGLFALIMLLGVLTAFFGRVLDGYKQVAWHTIINNFVGSPFTILLTVLLVELGVGLRGYISAQVASALLVLGLMIAMVWKSTPVAARSLSLRPAPFEREVISFSGTAIGLSLLSFVSSQADRVVIGFYLGARALGVYAMAAAFLVFLGIVLRSVNQIFGPTVADLHARRQFDLLGRIFQTTSKWILGLTVPLAGVMIIFARPLMSVFGRGFEAGWPVLVIGTLGVLVDCGVGGAGTLLFMAGHQRVLIRINGTTAVLMIGLGLLLTPRWGINGAATATAVTLAATNIWYVLEVHRKLGLFPYNRSYLRLLLPLAAAVGALVWLREKFGVVRHEWILIGSALLLAYLIFLAIALAFGLDPDDRLIAQAVWSRIRGIIFRAEVQV
jgi:O-antigen/teichoic acid export membrane protein